MRWDDWVGDVGEACVGDCGLIPGGEIGTEGRVRLFGFDERLLRLLSTASPAPASARLRSAMLPPLAVDTVSSFDLLYDTIKDYIILKGRDVRTADSEH